jgi:hypothetical protein
MHSLPGKADSYRSGILAVLCCLILFSSLLQVPDFLGTVHQKLGAKQRELLEVLDTFLNPPSP